VFAGHLALAFRREELLPRWRSFTQIRTLSNCWSELSRARKLLSTARFVTIMLTSDSLMMLA